MSIRMRQLTLMGVLGGMICICGALMYVEIISAYPALVGNIFPAVGFGTLSLGSIGSVIIWAAR